MEGGWNVWVWLMGVGEIYGCGCKEVYPLVSVLFLPYFLFILKMYNYSKRLISNNHSIIICIRL